MKRNNDRRNARPGSDRGRPSNDRNRPQGDRPRQDRPQSSRPQASRPQGPRPPGPRRENAPRTPELRAADRELQREDPRAEIAASLVEGIPAPFEILFGMNPVREALLANRRKFRRL